MNRRELVRQMILAIGDDPDRPGLKETPDRVVRSWQELFSGYSEDPTAHMKTFESDYDQIVCMRNVDYFSVCEHHMLPFYGRIHIAYIPNESGTVLGASKFARIVNVFSRRLQIQEQMTQQVAAAIQDGAKPKGVAIIADGTHLCMMARGVGQQHATMRTSALLGVFRDDAKARSEVMQLLMRD
jgi:GTP cyclohydrolase I